MGMLVIQINYLDSTLQVVRVESKQWKSSSRERAENQIFLIKQEIGERNMKIKYRILMLFRIRF